MYPSADQREADIDAGATRAAAELRDDLERAHAALTATWAADVRRGVGAPGLVARAPAANRCRRRWAGVGVSCSCTSWISTSAWSRGICPPTTSRPTPRGWPSTEPGEVFRCQRRRRWARSHVVQLMGGRMDSSNLWPTIHAERAALARDLEGLTDAQWQTQSLCDGWSVRELLAHMTGAATTTFPKFVVRITRAGFRPNVMLERLIDENLGTSSADTLARFTSSVYAESAPLPIVPVTQWLGEVIVHSEDIRSPLGIPHVYACPTRCTSSPSTTRRRTSTARRGAPLGSGSGPPTPTGYPVTGSRWPGPASRSSRRSPADRSASIGSRVRACRS